MLSQIDDFHRGRSHHFSTGVTTCEPNLDSDHSQLSRTEGLPPSIHPWITCCLNSGGYLRLCTGFLSEISLIIFESLSNFVKGIERLSSFLTTTRPGFPTIRTSPGKD